MASFIAFLFVLAFIAPSAAFAQIWEELNAPRVVGYIASVHADKRGNLYAVGLNHVYRSTNDGKNWDFITLNGYPAEIGGFVVDSNDFLYLTSYIFPGQNGYETHVSSDGGETWEKREKAIGTIYPLKNGDIMVADYPAFRISTNQGRLWDSVAHYSGNNMRGVDGDGGWIQVRFDSILRSTDRGKSWDRYTNPLGQSTMEYVFVADGMVYVSGTIESYATRITSSVWRLLEFPSSFLQFRTVQSYAGALIGYANNSSYVFRSKDSGETWTDYSDGLPKDFLIYDMKTDPTGRVLVTDGRKIFRTKSPVVFADVKRTISEQGGITISAQGRTVNIASLDELPLSGVQLVFEIHDLLGRQLERPQVEMVSPTQATVKLSQEIRGMLIVSLRSGDQIVARSPINIH